MRETGTDIANGAAGERVRDSTRVGWLAVSTIGLGSIVGLSAAFMGADLSLRLPADLLTPFSPLQGGLFVADG